MTKGKTKKYFKKISIPVDVYRTGVHIIITDDMKRLKTFLDTYFGKDAFDYEDFEGHSGNHFWSLGAWEVIHLKEYDKSSFTHELFHATCHILKNICIKLSDETEEIYAYLYGYLFKEAQDKIKKTPLT